MKSKSEFEAPNKLISDILNNHISSFKISEKDTRIILRVMRRWLKFAQQSSRCKENFSVGYKRGWYESVDKTQDIFDFHRDFKKRLIEKEVYYEEYLSLITGLEKLHNLFCNCSLEIAKKIDQRVHGRDIYPKVKKSMNDHVIRLIYDRDRPILSKKKERKNGVTNATFDPCLWTMVAFTSSPTLYLGLKLKDQYEHQEHKVALLQGAKFDNITAKYIKMIRSGTIKSRGDQTFLLFFTQIPLTQKITKGYIERREIELGLRKAK